MSEKWMQKRLKKITFYLILTSFILLISGVAATNMLNRMYKREIREQIRTEVNRYKININRKIEAARQTLYTLASFMEFSNDINTQKFVEGLYESNNHNSFIQMGYFSKDGAGVLVTLNGDINQSIQAEDTNQALYKVIQKAWEGESAVSDIYYDSSEKEDFIAHAVPVMQGENVSGALIACDKTSVFFDIMQIRSGFSEQGSIGIINDNGKFLVDLGQVDTDHTVHSIYDGDMLSQEDQQLFKQAVEDEEGLFLDVNYNSRRYMGFIEPVEVLNWYLIFIATEKGINEPMYRNMLFTRIGYICVLFLSSISILYGYCLMRKYNKDLFRFAYYDRLTGAYNILNFSQRLETVLENTREFSVVAVNIRKFKFINEIFGDQVANQLLCYVKDTIEKEIQENEFFCRETADKFYVLMKTDSREEVEKRLTGIAESIRKIFLDQHREYQIMLYAGVVSGTDIKSQDIKREELMTHVMFALSQARQNSQENMCFYDEKLHKKEQLRNYIESHMNQALKNGEFRLFLQPKIDLKQGVIGGAEALVRWITEDGNMIFPDQFIPLFEQNGFCTELDLYMMEQTCRLLREWMDQKKEPVPVSVNQSKLLFYREGYVRELCDITRKYQIPPQMITLEILEELAVEDAEGLSNRICELKEKGFRISMDDFGSGYSSLNVLSSLDIDELKLDRGFLMKKTGSQESRQQVVMKQIIEMAKKLNITTVAEGVETKEDEMSVLKAGSDYGQGYYYSRPVSAAEFTEKYIRKHSE